uniref:ShKT domain-containing protein n=1 Tax=Haptolina brevifila TaxID=156173 RepID=A0A7S2JRQ6_9EUKA|mmetsp:Transcript_8891/g.18063  ORF Transcript_8891/g.18063 Transcript_8891/m.18063 type:complete len:129 (+) Transcript_8891:223-609(+)
MQRIDLTRLQTTDNIHKLLKMLGMAAQCEDSNPECPSWKKAGECERNPRFMLTSCRLSCGSCEKKDNSSVETCKNESPDHDCEYWSTMGECTGNEDFMRTACAKACGVCTVQEILRNDDDEIDDKDEL